VSRTARLFELLAVLRARRMPVTAEFLAGRLDVSVRTVYRDVQALVALGAHVDGEAGVGFQLRGGSFLPPLMFGEEETEALVLGARWVGGQGDPALARAAESVLAKIAAAAPQDLRDRMSDTGLWAPRLGPSSVRSPGMDVIREAIRRECKLKVSYLDAADGATERVIWPIALAFFNEASVVAAFCELRGAFRHFRADRIARLEATGEAYPRRRRELTREWRSQLKAVAVAVPPPPPPGGAPRPGS
jgi:predicted DNA-binding transcriptional regulator YafY